MAVIRKVIESPAIPAKPEARRGEFVPSKAFLASIVTAVGLFLYFFGLNISSLWDNDESTYAEIAKEMLQRGHWLTLSFDHHVWFCHPPLYMWFTAGMFRLFGWNELTARFFPALFAVAGMLIAFEFGATLWNKKTGALAAVIFGTSLQYLVQGRMATMDSMFCAFLLAAFYCAWRAFEEKNGKWWTAFFLSCAFATLAKGVFGLAYPIFIFGIFFLASGEWRRAREVPWLKGVAIYLIVAAPWFVYETVRYGDLFVHQVFYFYTYQRVVSPILSQAGPWYYYIPVLLFGFLPWSGFLPNIAVQCWRFRGDRKILFLGSWIAATFIFFTLVSTKLPNYILFLYPPLALLLAHFWETLGAGRKILGICLSLALVAFLAGGLEVFALQKLLPKEMAGYLAHLFPILGVLGAGCAAALAAEALFKNGKLTLPLMAAGMALFWGIFTVSFTPILELYKPMKPLSLALRAYREHSPAPVVAYHVPGTASLVFYSDVSISDLGTPKELAAQWRRGNLYCFIDGKSFDALKDKIGPYKVLGHKRTLWLLSNFDPATGSPLARL